jgi:hypothetical protein
MSIENFIIRNMKRFSLLLAVFPLSIYGQEPPQETLDNIPLDSTVLYFPEFTFDSDVENRFYVVECDSSKRWHLSREKEFSNDTTLNIQFSSALFNAHEPVLFTRNDSIQIFRFLWVPSMAGDPTVVRIEHFKGKYFCYIKELGGPGGGCLGSLRTSNMIEFSADFWKGFQRSIDSISFWDLQTIDTGPGVMIYDGAYWILEGYENGAYKVVWRRSPLFIGTSKDFGECCKMMFKIAKLDSNQLY